MNTGARPGGNKHRALSEHHLTRLRALAAESSIQRAALVLRSSPTTVATVLSGGRVMAAVATRLELAIETRSLANAPDRRRRSA